MAASFASPALLRVEGQPGAQFAPASGYFRAADGWIRTHANYPHHALATARALGIPSGIPDDDGAAFREAVTSALASLPVAEAERRLRAAGAAAARLRTREEWLDSPEGAAAEEGEWITVAPPAPGQRAPDREARLEGLRVLALTRVVAGPAATRFLAALGADVIRIDPPHLPELRDQHIDFTFGVRTAAADLRDPETLARAQELAAEADVLVCGYRSGALERFGLRAPVEVHLNAWGWSGPWRDARGFDSVVQAAVGIGHLYGGSGSDGVWRPGALPVQALDHASGFGLAAAALELVAGGR
ncbi:MAG: CoA transferase, partial [bacterium]|nr:CoA transferase [bacterium]